MVCWQDNLPPQQYGKYGYVQGYRRAIKDALDGLENIQGISVDPHIRSGEPCIAGTRITCGQIIAQLAEGDSIDQIVEDFNGSFTKETIVSFLLECREFSKH